MKRKHSQSLRTLTHKTIWDISEATLFALWKDSERDADLKDNTHSYLALAKNAFDIVDVRDLPEVVKKYKALGYRLGTLKGITPEEYKTAVKKKTIRQVNEITKDNIHTLQANKLLELIDRNFGGGWDSLPKHLQDIIDSQFDIASTTLPKNKLHNPGGLYAKKQAQDYDVLEIPRGAWVEVIFAKLKPAIIDDDSGEDDIDLPDPMQSYGYDEGEDTDDTTADEDYDTTTTEEEEDEDDNFDGEFADELYKDDYDVDDEELTIDDVVAAEDER